ncbi:transcription termination factor NusA [Patescibacteria group bacterium]|nr:transcription termination factor NusA [Patescibacteria group bacterium]MBU1563554.1 transcription termination factor NusA [Patescibacteria group bacterium]MBU2068204.1 transcription termination factor NusA [Patescibacteria group bacterium]
MDTKSFTSAIEQICEEKGISQDKVMETIEMALAAAYKKEYTRKGQNIKIKFNLETGAMKVYQVRLVVDESMLKPETDEKEEIEAEEVYPAGRGEEGSEKKVRFNVEKHIILDEVKQPKGKKKKYKAGDEIKSLLKIDREFSRIAAQTAKQVIIQRIREAEREAIYDEYKEKIGQIVSGIVQRVEGSSVFFDIGKATGVLFPEEQIPQEHYRIGQRLRVYITNVQKDSRGSIINLSRAHPKMVSQLFSLEVPEISSGTVEIKSIAREPGSRSKIAVTSTEERVDPIGSMIGQKGTRVQAVINELAGEKIDIVEWSDNPAEFISSSLSPAKVIDVKIDEKRNQAEVTVPEDQLSLAIGIKGQNVRLAAKLTNWKIDIIAQKSKIEKTTKKKIIKKKEKKPKKKTTKKKVVKKKTEK